MEIKNSLKTILKRLKLSGILATLPERIAYAQKTKLPSEDLPGTYPAGRSRPTRPSQSATASQTRLLYRGANLREFRLGCPGGLRSPSRSRPLLAQFSRGQAGRSLHGKRGRRQNLPRFCSRPCSLPGRIRRALHPRRPDVPRAQAVSCRLLARKGAPTLSRPRPAHPRRLRATSARYHTVQRHLRSRHRAPSPLINDSHFKSTRRRVDSFVR